MKVKFRTGEVDLKGLRKRFRKVDEDRIHTVGECYLHGKESAIDLIDMGQIKVYAVEVSETWDCGKTSIAVLGDKN